MAFFFVGYWSWCWWTGGFGAILGMEGFKVQFGLGLGGAWRWKGSRYPGLAYRLNTWGLDRNHMCTAANREREFRLE